MQLHPEARKRIDEMAAGLVNGVTQRNYPSGGSSGFPSERHIKAHLTDADIIGEIQPSLTDQRGVTVGKWFRHEGKQYCIEGDAYLALRRVCERITKDSAYGKAVSLDFVETNLFDWVKDSYRGTEVRSFSAALGEAAGVAVRPMTVWIPIAGLEVEGPIPFGPASFRPITKALFDRWQSQGETVADEHRGHFDGYVAKARERLQGFAAVVVELVAEDGFAREQALELAEVALGLLKLHSPGAMSPWLTTTAALLGAEYEPRDEALIELGEGGFLHQRGLTERGRPLWRLSLAEVAHEKFYLGYLSRMVGENGLSEYQRRVRKALLTFAKASSISDINDRLVFLFSALEALLLKDTNEPIQHYLGERMAFLSSDKPDEMMDIVGIVKRAYALRSKYIHHQVGIDDAASLEKFCFYAWVIMYTCVHHFERYATVSDLLANLERAKFGGR